MSKSKISKAAARVGMLVSAALVATMLPHGLTSLGSASADSPTASAPQILGEAPTVARAALLKPSSMQTRGRLASFQSDALPARATGQLLRLNMFDDVNFLASVDHMSRESGFTSWSGNLSNAELGTWVATETNGIMMLTVNSVAGTYEVRPATANHEAYRVAQIRQDRPDEPSELPDGTIDLPEGTGGDISKLPYAESRLPTAAKTDLNVLGRSTPNVLQRKDSKKVLDIALVWSPQAAAANGGDAGMSAMAAQAVALSNQIYLNSGVGTQMRLVGVANTGVNEVGDFQTDLMRLTKANKGYQNVVRQAKRWHVDNVSMMINSDGRLCGLGWLNAKNFQMSKTVTATDCLSYYTVTHEVGHNQGAMHDRYVDRNPFFKYGYGEVNLAGGWRTVMAYPNECLDNGIVTGCTRIAYMSTPKIAYGGSPVGTKKRENNAKVLNKTRKRMARIAQSQIYGSKVKIRGKVKAKKRVRAFTRKGKWSPGKVKVKFRWFLDGVAVKGKKGKKPRLRLKKAWKGKVVAVAAIGKKRHYSRVVVYSKGQRIK